MTTLKAASATSALLLAGLTALAAPAHAAGAPERVDVSVTEILEGYCGDLTVRRDVDAYVLFSTVSRGPDGTPYNAERTHARITLTNLDNDKWMTIAFDTNFMEHQITDNGDGTLSVLLQDAGSFRISNWNRQRILMNGNARFVLLFDHAGTPNDPSDDLFLEDLGEVKLTGRHDPHGPTLCDDAHRLIG